MKVLYPITLDVKKTNIQKHIKAFTSEGGTRELIITLVSGNDTIELTNEYVVSVVGVKPDGTEFANTATVSDGKIHYTLTTQNVAVEGEVDCHIRVVKTNELLYTSKFAIDVEKNLSDEETETSSNEWTELIELIERAEKQVTVFTGEGAPSDDPDEFDNIKESDFYYNSTDKTYSYAKSVTTTIVWEGLIRATYFSEVISYINTNINAKADKTYVDTELAKKQNNLSAGNGIDLTNDTVSAKVENNTDNALSLSKNGLKVSKNALGYSGDFRGLLASQAVPTNRLATRAYVEEVALGLGNTIAVSINPTTYVMTLALKHGNEVLSTGSVDLPLETMVVGAEYDSETKEIVLTLQSGSTVRFSVADLVSGLVTESDFQDAIQAIEDALADKQDTLTAGSNVTISNNTISATDTKYSAGANITIDGNNVISASGGGGNPITDTAKGSTISLTDSADSPLDAISIMGKSTQNGTPTIDSPIPIVDTTTEEIEITDGTNTQSAELTKTLRGIPVSSGGNYTDNNNQQWLCDTIERYKDGSGKYIQRVIAYTFNGSENWQIDSRGRVVLNRIDNAIGARVLQADLTHNGGLFSYLPLGAFASTVTVPNVWTVSSQNFNSSPQGITQLSDWTDRLAQNNAKILLPLETPIETPLTAEELEELNLSTYKPTTTITSNPDVVVEYVCDVRTLIDGKQDKLTAGTNITIDSNNVISASGGGLSYTFTDGLTESSGTVGIDLASGSKLLIDSNDKLDIDLSDYATQTDLSSKQDTIDSTNKLDADLVDDTNSSNKFVSASEKQGWNAKADTTDIPTNVSELTNDSGYQTSSDVASAIANKEDKTDITTDTTSTTVSLTLADNHEYRYTTDLTSLTLTMPSGDFISSVVFASGSTPTSMTYDSSIKWSGDDVTSNAFVPQASKEYDILFYYNGLNINGIVRGV